MKAMAKSTLRIADIHNTLASDAVRKEFTIN
jgi:hypothetical protein